MVSLRCKIFVTEELNKLGVKYTVVELGVVEIPEGINPELRAQLKTNLLTN